MIRYLKQCLSVWCLMAVPLIAIVPALSSADTLFTADDPHINYSGRFDFTDPLSPRWNWSGSTIEACFSGPTIGIGIVDGKADYDVEIDGVIDTIIRTQTNVTRYTISADNSNTMHTVRIVQRSENHVSAAAFKGLYLADNETLGNAPEKPFRKIEFIGNSDLVAYGVESTSRSCTDAQLRKYTNTNRSFGTLIAKMFDAQSVVLGWSGKGLVRNYSSPSKRDTTSFTAYYGKTLGMLGVDWDFSKWVPDLVVIVLGWNDFSSSSPDESRYPDDTMYIGDYHKFIAGIRSHYPDAAVLCVATHIRNLVEYVKRVVTEENTSLQHPRVYFAEYPLDASLELTGCNGHPSQNDQRIIAGVLADTIKKRLGWDTGKVNVRVAPYRSRTATSTQNVFNAYLAGQQIVITTAASLKPGTGFMICAADGRIIRRVTMDRKNRTVISTSTLPAGLYVIGNTTAGWRRFAITR
jgi:hypothetical protein